MRPSNCIDLINESDGDEMFYLRSRSYKKQYGADVDVSALKWNSWDERFINLGVFAESELVSLLRIAYINDHEEYKKIMLCDFDSDVMSMPLVVLSRAATSERYESQGFHSILRLQAFRLSKAARAEWIVGTFKKDSKRVPQLLEMGYELSTNPIPWGSFLKSREPTLVARLNMARHFIQAEKRLVQSTQQLQEKYPVVFDFNFLVERMHKA